MNKVRNRLGSDSIKVSDQGSALLPPSPMNIVQNKDILNSEAKTPKDGFNDDLQEVGFTKEEEQIPETVEQVDEE